MTDDRVAAYLAEVRKRAAATKASAHGYAPRGEALPAGPCGEWVIANIAAGADALPLLAAVEAVLELHHRDHRKVPLCEGCDYRWPCPTARAISAALLGERPDGQ